MKFCVTWTLKKTPLASSIKVSPFFSQSLFKINRPCWRWNSHQQFQNYQIGFCGSIFTIGNSLYLCKTFKSNWWWFIFELQTSYWCCQNECKAWKRKAKGSNVFIFPSSKITPISPMIIAKTNFPIPGLHQILPTYRFPI